MPDYQNCYIISTEQILLEIPNDSKDVLFWSFQSKMTDSVYADIFIRPRCKKEGTCLDFIFTQFVRYPFLSLFHTDFHSQS